MSEPPRSIDEQIRQAMERGEFDNLPGKGKPLNLDENPYEDPGWRTAYRMLKDNGFTLPWIEKRRDIEDDFEKSVLSLRQKWECWQNADAHRGMAQPKREWQQALQSFREEITKLNKRIRDYNLKIPSNQFQRRSIDIEQEIAKITASSD